MTDYLKQLNEAQREAVEHTDGPLLVLAGAGSGKTRVLTYRLAHILKTRHTRDILAVTFTNKAAAEMVSRVESLLGSSARGLWVLTFHSMGNRILRREIEKLGRNPHFTILDESDQTTLIKECIKELNLDPKMWSPQYIKGVIDRAKNSLIPYETLVSQVRNNREGNTLKVYELYQKKLATLEALDFNDLLVLPVELFRNYQDVLMEYRQRFRYILVDEYQDTNHAQYELIKLLVGAQKNICVVGDEDQSIYRWRGADITNILSFQKDFPEAKVVKLEKNYRSTAVVLKAAERVIDKNTQRIGKKLLPVREEGEPIILYIAYDERDEAQFVADKIQELLTDKEKYQPDDIAVFYRTHAQSRSIENALLERNINYTVVGGVKFFERKEIKDALAYLRLFVNPKDDLSFLRIVNVPPRKIGNATIEDLKFSARANNVSLFEAAVECSKNSYFYALNSTKKRQLGEFAKLMLAIREETQDKPVSVVIDTVLQKVGYYDWLKNEKTIEAVSRLENLDELVKAAEEYETSTAEPTPAGFLDSVSLYTDIDSLEGGVVTLMTIHTAKGLEFKVVFMVGMEEGIFPHALSAGDFNAMEEERRLCYVGMTRAKDLLFLSMARYRFLRGQERYNLPSQFLEDIPKELITIIEEDGKERESEDLEHFEKLFSSSQEKTIEKPYDVQDYNFRPGQRVNHPYFGGGLVEAIEGKGEKMKVKVYFHKFGHKILMAKYANLEPAR